MDRPKVGVGVIIQKDGKFLLGKRMGSHGEGCWCFPGGHLEGNEAVEDCAIRETEEETGVKIKNIRKATYTNDIFTKEGKHYVTLFVVADHDSGDAKVMEPEKCERWDWFEWDDLPYPLFVPVANLVEDGFRPY